MRYGIFSVYTTPSRSGVLTHGPSQSGIGPLIAAYLPNDAEIDIIDESFDHIDWRKDYDLLFIHSFHAGFDRARQVSHYWRRRGAKTVYGGSVASTFPDLCQPYFDAVAIGDADGIVPFLMRDFLSGNLLPRYTAVPFDPLSLPTPRFDLFAGRRIAPIQFEASRGCPFSCDFCILSALGTRYHTRPVELVVRDILEAQKLFNGPGNWLKRNFVGFLDNNLGGNPKFLGELCRQLKPLNIKWACAITFNVLSTPGVIKMMSQAGCVGVFVGIESFNPKTLADMNKRQNRLEHVNRIIDECLLNGILLTSGMMINPSVDDIDYMQRLPGVLAESGLCIPEFLSFEAPFPGTPKFERLSRQDGPAFLPNTSMYDFDANTLVTVPKDHDPQEYVAAYRRLRRTLPNIGNVLLKLRSQVPPLIKNHAWLTIGGILYEIRLLSWKWNDHPERTYIGGSDIVPPEILSVPFAADDFESEFEKDDILSPWKVTDDQGHVLDKWLHHHQPYSR